jgi:type I restriction enzyme S subunit
MSSTVIASEARQSSWRECKLGDVAEVIGGGTPKTAINEYWNGNIPWLTPRDLTGYDKVYISHGERFITGSGLKNSSAKLMPKGTVLLTSRAPIGYVVIAENEICTNQGFKSLVPKFEILNSEFLYYWLKSNTDYLQQLGTGTTFAEISGSVVKDIDIFLPPLEEQKAIAEVLSSLDDKIDLLHRQNRTLESLAQTLFRQWFIEEAKEEWEIGTLGEVIEIFDNKRIPLSKMERDKMKDGELYPYYGAAQIMDYVNDFIFDGEYILMGEDGTVRTDEGYPILQYATGKFWVNNHTHVLQAKEPYSNFFIWNYLVKKNIDEIVTGAVQPKINQGNLKSLDFPQYPLDLIQDFNEQSQTFFEKINQNKKQIQTLENLRDMLLPKLLSGEARVKI